MTKCKHRTHRQYADADGNELCRSCIRRHPYFWKWKMQYLKVPVGVRLDRNMA